MAKRRILEITGTDARDFLQGLVTNDVDRIDDGLVYAALLTPQGKYITDFFLAQGTDGILLDVAETHAATLVTRLSMYKLRADVHISETALHLHRGLGDPPDDACRDPRHDALGWRAYRPGQQDKDTVDWDALRVEHMIPEAGEELTPDTFILEMGFERLSGVDFRKGCYVGQEVTARMKHKTELRKGLARVKIHGSATSGTELTVDGRPAGRLHTVSGGNALAYLRFDRAASDMVADEATVRRID